MYFSAPIWSARPRSCENDKRIAWDNELSRFLKILIRTGLCSMFYCILLYCVMSAWCLEDHCYLFCITSLSCFMWCYLILINSRRIDRIGIYRTWIQSSSCCWSPYRILSHGWLQFWGEGKSDSYLLVTVMDVSFYKFTSLFTVTISSVTSSVINYFIMFFIFDHS